jgi:hypothetical protein
MKRVFAILVGFAWLLPMAGCGGKPQPAVVVVEEPPSAAPPPMAVTRPTDIPLPPRHTLDLERTVMVGSDNEWFGRASLSVPVEPIGIWDFYRREMPRQGWAEISAAESPNRVLFYQRGNRVAVIEMRAGRNSSYVDIWMNPRQPAEPPVAAAAPAPAEPPSPEVQREPTPEQPAAESIENAPLPLLPWQ